MVRPAMKTRRHSQSVASFGHKIYSLLHKCNRCLPKLQREEIRTSAFSCNTAHFLHWPSNSDSVLDGNLDEQTNYNHHRRQWRLLFSPSQIAKVWSSSVRQGKNKLVKRMRMRTCTNLRGGTTPFQLSR